MSVVLVFAEQSNAALRAVAPPPGMYLSAFSAEANGGLGWADYSHKKEEALIFRDREHARAVWLTRSRIRPNRPTGEPNRPLYLFTMIIEEA